MTYSQKLRDPRWQKKRLQILDRDKWACLSCKSTTKNLQVHHIVYAKRDPWDYPDECYQTLCDVCHEERQRIADDAANRLKLGLSEMPTEAMESFINAMFRPDAGDGSDAFRKTLAAVLHQACDRSEKGESVLDHKLFFESVMGLFSSQIYIEPCAKIGNNGGLVSSTVSALKKVILKLEGLE